MVVVSGSNSRALAEDLANQLDWEHHSSRLADFPIPRDTSEFPKTPLKPLERSPSSWFPTHSLM